MIRFVVDSTFGISEEYKQQHNIKVTNLKLILDEKVTEEGGVPEWQEFYSRLEKSKGFPTTSQPSPQEFIDNINEIFKEDKDAEIFVLTIASYLSGTFNGASLAVKEFEDKKVTVIDTKSACVAERIFLEELVDLAESGKTYDELLGIIPTLQEKIKIQFIPQTMEYLKRGGRVGKLSAAVADILKIKPIFEFRNNVINITKKVIGLGKGISEMLQNVPQKFKKLYVCYIHDDSNVQKIVEKVKNVLKIQNPIVSPVDPVFGSHVGIGAVGIATLEEY